MPAGLSFTIFSHYKFIWTAHYEYQAHYHLYLQTQVMPSNWNVKAAQSTKTNMGTDGEMAAQLEAGTLITLSHSERILCKAAEAGDHYSSHIQIASLSEG